MFESHHTLEVNPDLISRMMMLLDNNTNTTTTVSTNNSCDPSLMNTPWSRETNGTFLYGLCPDTWVSFSLCLAFLVIYVTTIGLSCIGAIWKRNSGHIKNRSLVYLLLTLGAGFVFIVGLVLRIIIGRKIFPCGLLTICFFTFPPAVTLPTIFRYVVDI